MRVMIPFPTLFALVIARGSMFFFFLIIAAIIAFLRYRARRGIAVGFLHPNAGAGGGGERVLWLMLQALMEFDAKHNRSKEYVLYTKRYPATDGSDETLLAIVKEQFGVVLPSQGKLRIVYLSPAWIQWTEASRYRRLTLVLHSIGSAIAVFAAVMSSGCLAPIIYDTVGIPFVYPLLSLVGIKAYAYVHYPVISTDMIQRIQSREAQFNNSSSISSSPLLSRLKLWYYRLFAAMYRGVGWFCHEVFTNSTWTNNHITQLWPRPTKVLFPPCNVTHLHSEISSLERHPWIVSVGQFRPEKDHPLQLRAFARARSEGLPKDAKLILIGGARNREDKERVENLKSLAKDLKIDDAVIFKVSIPLSELRDTVTHSSVGLHCMRDEHFGIGVVEYLAAGCVPVAHNSGGVKNDIVRSEFGFLATTEEEFSNALIKAMQLDPATSDAMRRKGFAQAAKFSDAEFSSNFTKWSSLCTKGR